MSGYQVQDLSPLSFPDTKFDRYGFMPVEFFRTPRGYYIFDINHVTFLEVTEVVYKIVSLLSTSPKDDKELFAVLPEYSPAEIKTALLEIDEIKDEGYLTPVDFKRQVIHSMPRIKNALSNELTNLYLNITPKCNLVCSYCIFGGDYDHHSSLKKREEMSWETVRKSIDFFLTRAKTTGKLRVDFFGGEPLMAFPLIQRAVEELKRELKQRNQDLVITIASNGTLLPDRIIDFFIEHQVLYQISLDGSKEVHDANRKFRTTKAGSYDLIIENLRKLYQRDPDYYKKKVSLKGVISTQFLDKNEDSIFDVPEINTLIKLRRYSMINQTPHFDLKKDDDYFNLLHRLGEELLKKEGCSTQKELLEGLSFKKCLLYQSTFIEFFQVQLGASLYYETGDPVPFMKGCLMGMEGCINADGSISICYKAESFKIGSVHENTWYFDKIEEYQHARYNVPACKSCFTQRFCDFCYEKINGKNEQLKESIWKHCEFKRHEYRIVFQYMLMVMEKNPGLWDELQEDADKRYREEKARQESKKDGRPESGEKGNAGAH